MAATKSTGVSSNERLLAGTTAAGPVGLALGLDLGSTSIKGLLLDDSGQVGRRVLKPLQGGLARTVLSVVEALGVDQYASGARLGVTGQGRQLLRRLPGGVIQNEVLCLLAGVGALVSTAGAAACPRSVIEIGGQISRFIELEPGAAGRSPTLVAFALNDQCAAGAGAFLVQQAGRLKMSVGELGKIAAQAAAGSSIAGRCAVFAKSDMIHLQQKGVGVPEIAYGLCLALARNFVGTVLRGRAVKMPVALAGGGALNLGLGRAFAEVLRAEAQQVSVLPEPVFVGAVGAATLAARQPSTIALAGLLELLRSLERPSTVAPPLALPPGAQPAVAPDPKEQHSAGMHSWAPPLEEARPAEPLPSAPLPGETPLDRGRAVADSPVAAYLGIDLGSVSTDLVLVAPNGALLAGIYLPTRGRPLEVLSQGLRLLGDRCPAGLAVLGAGTTGSGRHLAARLLGADLVHNEITAQLRGALRCYPEVESIFEIGGQDSKYIRVERGRLADFAMNKVCAAGTGSFLEEQCENLGLDVRSQFSTLAAASSGAVDLGSRCTVFMETELVNARRAGAGLPELTAGLALAVARNYLQRVVGNRPIGRHVVFQGGVANNTAVRAAFEQLLGRPVMVHAHPGLSGAIGVALLTAERQAGRRSQFRGLAAVGERHPSRAFECKHCENRCQVVVVQVGDAQAHFGDTCERYTVRDGAGAAGRKEETQAVPNLFAERDALLRSFLDAPSSATSSATSGATSGASSGAPWGDGPRGADALPLLGLPRAGAIYEYLPFCATFFRQLGFRVVLSPASSAHTLELGNRHLPAETCLPIKMTFGHLAALHEAGVDLVLVPSIVTLDDPVQGTGVVCPFTSAVPYMAQAALDVRILTPALVLGKELRHFAEEMGPTLHALGVPAARLPSAYEKALAAQAAFRGSLRARGAALLGQGFEHALVVLGRPYNLGDPFQNLGLGRHLQRLGVLALPQAYLPGDEIELDDLGGVLPWRFPRDSMRAALFSLRDPRLHAIFVTSFGCGPDAFVQKYLAEALAHRPPLLLEFDEHRGEAGMVTRIEAYLDHIRATDRVPGRVARDSPPAQPALPASPAPPTLTLPPTRAVGPPRQRRAKPRISDGPFYIPYVADHVYALEGALRYLGAEAEVLPLPDGASIAAGEAAASGKECHAYAMIAGDLLRLAERLGPGRRGSFLYFGSAGPCLLTQFGEGYRLLLAERGIDHIRVLDPSGRDGFLGMFGLGGVRQLWRGLVACDLLHKWLCENRPYETHPGSAEVVRVASLRDLSDSLARGDLPGFAERTRRRMAGVESDRRQPRPLVGVAGDLYTRINPAANQGLFHTLETMGCEIWPAPFLVDVTDFGMTNAITRALAERRTRDALATTALLLRKDLETLRVRRHLASPVRHADEPGYRELLRLSAPYLGPRSIEMLLLDVGKTVDFAQRGADGVVHAICLSCMMGTAAAALLGRIRKDHGLPVVSLVYGASEGPAQRTKLEAFVHQVREHHATARGPA